MGEESRESAPLQNKHSTLRKSLQISGHYTTHPMSTEWATSRWLLLHSVSECLIRLDEPLGSSKVESPSPICHLQSRKWLGESVLVLLNGQKHKPVSQYRTSTTLCRGREVVLVHPLGKATAITNLKIKHCKKSLMSQKKPICPSFTRQNFKQFIAQTNGYLASFLSVGFALSSDFFWNFALNFRQWLPKTHNLKLLVGFWFG